MMSDLKAGQTRDFGFMKSLTLLKKLPDSRWFAVSPDGRKYFEVGAYRGVERLSDREVADEALEPIRDAFLSSGLMERPQHCRTCQCLAV